LLPSFFFFAAAVFFLCKMDSLQREHHEETQQQKHNDVTTASPLSSSSRVAMSVSAQRSLFDLDDDIFTYICAFIPIDDLLLHLPSVNREVRRRVWVNYELWQQLWMHYLVQFVRSLVPPPRPVSFAAASVSGSASPFLPTSPWPVGATNTTSVMDTTAAHNDAAWRLYHYHTSKEARPRVELLERLSLTPADISDPSTAEAPQQAATHTFFSPTGTTQQQQQQPSRDAAQEQTLRFAQLYATQLVANNLTHAEATAAVPSLSSPPSRVVATTSRERKAAAVGRRRERQAERLRRALHFLLSASSHRPAFQDHLWTTTYEACEAYRREMKDFTDAAPMLRQRRGRQRSTATAQLRSEKDQLRPLSWLDNRDSSVKVLLFDDNSRSVGDAGSVQAERIKLLAAIAHHWRIAYAHQFYLTPTDGKEHGSHARFPPSTPPHPRTGVSTGSEWAAALPNVLPASPASQEPPQDGRATWEQVYRRFRDDNTDVRSTRIRDSLRRVAVGENAGAGAGADGSGSAATGTAQRSSSASRPQVIPSSGNPLFDLHLLAYGRRKQFYAAMLASTVEVPDGMGAFFATCVSEPFLRWWCWRSRRLYDIAAAGAAVKGAYHQLGHSLPAPARSSQVLAPSATAPSFSTLLSTPGAVPTTLWVARVCSVHKPQYGTTASDGGFGRPAPIEAAESIVYSSSYTDVTSPDTLASDSSSSIEFVQEGLEERMTAMGDVTADITDSNDGEDGVDAFQSYPDNGADSSSGSNLPLHREAQQRWRPPPRSSLARASAPRVALLFPLPHMLAYWFMMHHVTFYSYQVYRRIWGDQEITIAVCSRILSPAGHSVECRLFYTLRCTAFPRMYTKMMFTPGTLPALTLQEKMSARSPYRSPSTTDASSSLSTSSDAAGEARPAPLFLQEALLRPRRDSDSDSSEEPTGPDPSLPSQRVPPASPVPPSSSSTAASSEPRRGKHTTLDHKAVDSRQVYDLFWTGFGRVEVESVPTIARSNFVRLRVALGLPVDFPMGLLWNVVMFASGVGPLILKDHRHSLYFNYSKSFTDVVEEEFGEVSCYGYGARPISSETSHPMPNPLDAEVELMREQHNLDEAARTLVQRIAHSVETASSNPNGNGNDEAPYGEDADASFSTADPEHTTGDNNNGHQRQSASPPTPTLSLTSSLTTYGSWGVDSEFSSAGGHSSWRDWHTSYSDDL
jgi:hypothetical protein